MLGMHNRQLEEAKKVLEDDVVESRLAAQEQKEAIRLRDSEIFNLQGQREALQTERCQLLKRSEEASDLLKNHMSLLRDEVQTERRNREKMETEMEELVRKRNTAQRERRSAMEKFEEVSRSLEMERHRGQQLKEVISHLQKMSHASPAFTMFPGHVSGKCVLRSCSALFFFSPFAPPSNSCL